MKLQIWDAPPHQFSRLCVKSKWKRGPNILWSLDVVDSWHMLMVGKNIFVANNNDHECVESLLSIWKDAPTSNPWLFLFAFSHVVDLQPSNSFHVCSFCIFATLRILFMAAALDQARCVTCLDLNLQLLSAAALQATCCAPFLLVWHCGKPQQSLYTTFWLTVNCAYFCLTSYLSRLLW